MPYEPIRLERLKQVLNKLRDAIYEPVAELDVTAWVTTEPVRYEERMRGGRLSWRVENVGVSYGIVPGSDSQAVFRPGRSNRRRSSSS